MEAISSSIKSSTGHGCEAGIERKIREAAAPNSPGPCCFWSGTRWLMLSDYGAFFSGYSDGKPEKTVTVPHLTMANPNYLWS